MRTAAKRHLVSCAHLARAAVISAERAALETSDPQAIELAVIAGLALEHLVERATELDDDDLDDDFVELEEAVG